MRERASALVYIVAAAALCGSSLVAVQRVRASSAERTRAAELAKQEREAARNTLREHMRELDAIMRELDALDAEIQQAIKGLQGAQSVTERADRSETLRRLQREVAVAKRRAAELRPQYHSPCRLRIEGLGADATQTLTNH